MSLQTLETIMAKRRQTVTRNGTKVLESHGCPETGAGVVLAQSNWGEKQISAYFFKPRTHRMAFRQEPVTSNHQMLGIRNRLRQLLDQEKAAKVAPHDLKVGEILACIWGVTMQNVRFYKVVDIPHPRKVTVVQIASRMVSGDWVSGQAVPEENDPIPEDAPRETYLVGMSNGYPDIKTGCSIDRMSRWSGKPIPIYSD